MIHPFGQLEHRSLERRSQSGFTLVELLVTLSIIGILATAMLGVAAVAGDTAREAKTRHTISRLHTLLMEQVDSYKTRRVRLKPEIRNSINNPNLVASQNRGRALANARLFALRELMLMELPDRWSDVVLSEVNDTLLNAIRSRNSEYPYDPIYLTDRSGLSAVYWRRFEHIARANNKLTGNPNTQAEIRRHQGAECLYLVITLATADGEARSLFGESSIGDVDGDGAPEFLDGWGHPISFLRWAPGVASDAQLNANALGNRTDESWKVAAAGDHDPFDMYRRESTAFRTMPLIFSGGPDEIFGIYTGGGAHDSEISTTASPLVWHNNSPGIIENSAPFIRPILSPFQPTGNVSVSSPYLGTTINKQRPNRRQHP
ncbi:MAG: prepilin-type N-terminal cleavage/methylation domain-containing protein [Mariniblastus sp.]|nr:prepilin-type N-terminal cleavage/methylation domain-containing protein [Mariniblastus sp.]